MRLISQRHCGRKPARFLRILLPVLCLLLSFAISGCSSEGGDSQPEGKKAGTYRIYRQNTDGDMLISADFKPKSEDFEGILNEVMDQFCSPSGEGALSALPDTVTINSYAIGISEIDVDFSSDYLSLGRVPELLLRSALVKTLVQLPGVDNVRFTVEGQPLSIDGEQVGAMTGDTFIVPDKDTINSYRTREINLYFSNSSGDRLVKEKRRIYYSSNINTERKVAEQIIKGPEAANDNLLPVTSSSVIVLGARVKGSTCLIDFSSSVNNLPAADSPVNPEVALYAFVNSICDACGDLGVTGVRFTIEGKSDDRFRGQVNLDQTFTPDMDMVDSSQGGANEAGVVVDEQAGDVAAGQAKQDQGVYTETSG